MRSRIAASLFAALLASACSFLGTGRQCGYLGFPASGAPIQQA
jgi:hypothetical protein